MVSHRIDRDFITREYRTNVLNALYDWIHSSNQDLSRPVVNQIRQQVLNQLSQKYQGFNLADIIQNASDDKFTLNSY